MLLFAFIATVLARPGLYESEVYAAPAYTTAVVHEPAYAHVGTVIKTVPSAISHQSHSIVHSSAHVVKDVLAPVVHSNLYTTKSVVAAPVYVKSVAPAILHNSW